MARRKSGNGTTAPGFGDVGNAFLNRIKIKLQFYTKVITCLLLNRFLGI